jgi:hypothetical protein
VSVFDRTAVEAALSKPEEGPMTFSKALKIIKRGGVVTREGWNGKGMWIGLMPTDAGKDMTRPYIFMKTADNGLVPWVASQTDLLAEDWR